MSLFALRPTAVAVALIVLVIGACDDPGESDTPETPVTEASPRDPSPRVFGRLPAGVTESSGIVASRRNPGVLWTHNDSGGDPEIFCIDRRGRACGVWAVTGAESFDWEDIAAGPGPGGDDYLYVGDIGDNEAQRSAVIVYRVPEPDVSSDGRTTEPAEALEFTYPGGPRDAETLMVHPDTGDLYIVSKGSRPLVYVARAPLQSRSLKLVGALRVRSTFPGPTAGDIAPDGEHVVFASYTGGYELTLTGGTFDRIWKQEPQTISLPGALQREAIGYTLNGRSVVTTSEGKRTPIHIVPLAR